MILVGAWLTTDDYQTSNELTQFSGKEIDTDVKDVVVTGTKMIPAGRWFRMRVAMNEDRERSGRQECRHL